MYVVIDVYKTYIVGIARNVLSNVEAITDCSFYSFCFLTNTEKKENYILCNITHFQSLNKKTISDALRIQNLPRVRVQLFSIQEIIHDA